MIGTSVPIKSYALESTKTQADIVIRVGEYENKPGKRLDNVSSDFDIDVPIREENGVYSVREYDFNYKVANAIVKYLESQGVNVILQPTESKKQDLNASRKNSKIL